MRKYWLLFGFVFCISLLFAQNRVNYDMKDYEPVKLNAYKTHPKATLPEDVELEPVTESANKTSEGTSKSQITIKEELVAIKDKAHQGKIEKEEPNNNELSSGSKNNTSNSQSMKSIYDYAKQLEKTGNKEAAAAVYKLIIKNGGTELIQKAHKDIPIIEAVDELKQIEKVFTHKKGIDGK